MPDLTALLASVRDRLQAEAQRGLAAWYDRLGVQTEADLFDLFGLPDRASFIAARRSTAGPRWYHGTSVEAAAHIAVEGFRLDLSGARVGTLEAVGPVVWFGALEHASRYGPRCIVVELEAPPADWNTDPRCVEARESLGLMSAEPRAWPVQGGPKLARALAAALLARGVRAVVCCAPDSQVAELRDGAKEAKRALAAVTRERDRLAGELAAGRTGGGAQRAERFLEVAVGSLRANPPAGVEAAYIDGFIGRNRTALLGIVREAFPGSG